jgi:hypothetical protein
MHQQGSSNNSPVPQGQVESIGVSNPPAKTECTRRGVIPAPITIIHQHTSPGGNNLNQGHPSGSEPGMEPSPAASDFLDRPIGGGGPLTPMLGPNIGPPSSFQSGQGFIDPDLSLITLDEESPGVDECQPSTCPKGGLHMADHRQMMAFAKRVSRLRFHSQCGPGPNLGEFNTSLAPSPGTSPSSTSSSGMMQARARMIKRSFSLPNIKKPIQEEDSEEDGTCHG